MSFSPPLWVFDSIEIEMVCRKLYHFADVRLIFPRITI
ncbi:protein of unknown function [Brevefilum fermentans]|uniref:Uncharacterized protein n=1 Tax=Candidatus Brevifilum fermentans TaxID=1986204 RepID=A0A1Y6K3Y7_9CHLR|nr:protein of unknown function [Brevefilum fermentans]